MHHLTIVAVLVAFASLVGCKKEGQLPQEPGPGTDPFDVKNAPNDAASDAPPVPPPTCADPNDDPM